MILGNIIDIYRIEHKERREGPFVMYWGLAKELHKVMEHIQTQDVKLPSPKIDFVIKGCIPYAMKFGCVSINQLKEWFIEPNGVMGHNLFLKGLYEAGFVISHYQTPKHLAQLGKSGKQVMFDTFETELIKHIPVTELLN